MAVNPAFLQSVLLAIITGLLSASVAFQVFFLKKLLNLNDRMVKLEAEHNMRFDAHILKPVCAHSTK